MAKLSVQKIRDAALSIIASNPGGIRYSSLVDAILKQSPETPRNTINGSVWNLDSIFPTQVAKPSRGLFTPAQAGSDAIIAGKTEEIGEGGAKVKESDFYEPFAEFLKNDLGDVVEVAALGGAGLKSKWATPDVIGVYKPLAKNHIKFDLEIVSAEIKIDQQAVIAFGQAVAYRLFSAKTYIAMPKTITEEDKERLESLCMLFGVGLVLFSLNKDDPKFEIRMRAQRVSPDMFYVNEFADRLKSHDPDKFQKLFG
jgi:hypothetical protein